MLPVEFLNDLEGFEFSSELGVRNEILCMGPISSIVEAMT